MSGWTAFAHSFNALAKYRVELSKSNQFRLTPVGDELVMVQVRDTLTIDGKSHARDVVVVWRIVDGRVVEVWGHCPWPTSGE